MRAGFRCTQQSAGIHSVLSVSRDLRSNMGTTLAWIFAVFALICGRGAALKCYMCESSSLGEGESDPDCVSNPAALTVVECPPYEGNDTGVTPRCLKEVGKLIVERDSSSGTSSVMVEGDEVIRSCAWAPPDTPENQCEYAQSGGQPIEEFTFLIESRLTEIIDVYSLCVCNTDSCNGVDALQPSHGLLAFVLASAALMAVWR